MTKTAVLSRFKETDDYWHNTLIDNDYDVIIYDKYSGENILPNVGRESHTYISYIITNYHNLPKEILFSQYHPKDHFIHATKEQRSNAVDIFLNSFLYDFIGIRPGQFPYTAAGTRKVPWIKICKDLFVEFDQQDINKLISTGSTLNGVFRVSKEAILKHPLFFYEHAISLLDHHVSPMEGYFFERIWRFLFTNYGYIDNIKYSYLINYPLLYSHHAHKSRVFNNTFGHIKLYSDGNISSNGICYHSHKNERFWSIRDKKILLFNYCGALTNIVHIDENMPFIVDTFDISTKSWTKNNGRVLDCLNYNV